jgi:hypothetical protein
MAAITSGDGFSMRAAPWTGSTGAGGGGARRAFEEPRRPGGAARFWYSAGCDMSTRGLEPSQSSCHYFSASARLALASTHGR